MPNKYETALMANPEHFLGRYAVTVRGGGANRLASSPQGVGARTVSDQLNIQGFALSTNAAGSTQRTAVALTAPMLTATIAKTAGRDSRRFFDFSATQVTVDFDAYQAGVGVPIYLIPYEGARSRGVKLPAHGTDALAAVAAMTATQNGCTAEISGVPQSPYASHTNVIDAAVGARQAKMDARLRKLQQRFAAAELAGPGGNAAAANVGLNRRQFNFYLPEMAGAVPAPVAQQLNYKLVANQLVSAPDGNFHLVKTLQNPWVGVRTLDYFAAPANVATVQGFMPNAILMGMRTAGGWAFYYQIWTALTLHVFSVTNRDMRTLQWEMEAGAKKRFNCTAIVDYGEFWPNQTSHPMWV